VVSQGEGSARDRIGAIVGHRVGMRVLAAYGLGEIAEVYLGLPATLVQSGDDSVDDAGFAPRNGFALSDPTLGGSACLLGGTEREGLRLGVATTLTIPAGDDEALSGDGGLGLGVDFLGAFASGALTPVATLGLAYRPKRTIGNAELGSELRFGAGLHVVPAEIARLVFELHGASAFDLSSAGTALELAAGVQIRVSGLVLDAGLGLGLTEAPGTPDFRAIIAAGYAPPAGPDRGGDDGDDSDGGSEGDPDGDGLAGDADQCPAEPEDRDRHADGDGCPDLDDDADGVPDATDGCRNEPESRNGVADDDGCPERVRITETHIEAPTPILFTAGSSDLDDATRESLRAVAAALRADAAIRFVQIEGHTSDEGSRRRALSLSERRAATVLRFLVSEGIAEDRLGAVGNGAAQPLSPENTPDAHRRNRRVEIRIIERASP
jgi:outer membrane protein OmpA-like peptidoglycan-associated protein